MAGSSDLLGNWWVHSCWRSGEQVVYTGLMPAACLDPQKMPVMVQLLQAKSAQVLLAKAALMPQETTAQVLHMVAQGAKVPEQLTEKLLQPVAMQLTDVLP